MIWLFNLLFAVFGAGVITFAYIMMLKVSPWLNQVNVEFLQANDIDPIFLVFWISLIISGIVVILMAPKKKKAPKSSVSAGSNERTNRRSKQEAFQGHQAKAAAEQLDQHLNDRKKFRKQVEKEAEEKEFGKIESSKVMPRPD